MHNMYPSQQTLHTQQSLPRLEHDQPKAQPLLLLGPETTGIDCPLCHSSVNTAVKFTCNSRTVIASALCAFICCCWLPLLMDSTKNSDHYCPKCQKYLGTYQK